MTMSARSYILTRQKSWATRRSLEFDERGYVEHIDQNLFEPLCPEATAELLAGDGHELHGAGGRPGHIRSLRSSSAAAVNVFHYWKRTGRIPTIARACRVPSPRAATLHFEARHPIDPILERDGAIPPNLDVEIRYDGPGPIKATAFECKLLEPYGSSHDGLRTRYLDPDLSHVWEGLPHLLDLARRISPADRLFVHLNAAQLIKHILGLRRSYGKQGFWLAYLWNSVPGHESVAHAAEAATFKTCAKADGVQFRPLTYQGLIARLYRHHRPGNEAYVDYLVGRYL